MSILSVDTIQPIGSGSTVTVNAAKIVVGTGITFESNGQAIYAGIITATSFSGSGANLTSLPAQATIANNADNRVITGGSGVNLNGESTLTYDGTNLDLGDGKYVRLGASNDFQMWHDSGGNSYIKETGGGALVINADDFYLQNNATTTYLRTHSGGAIDLNFGGNKKFETMSTGARIQGGLLFNSDTAAANTLDDYEEGSWTPDWRGASALGTTTYGTYNVASYVKIGNQVTIRGYSQIRGSSGGSGFWFINNLPFTVGGGDDRRYRSVGTVLLSNFNFQDSERDIVCYIERNNNDMQIRGTRDNLSDSANISVNMDTNFDITWTITYPTA
tara:strand:- start:673 stop:1668 length:996 start_codon:yes stop_codon:yes gene_type:complete